jgi:regulator of nucleoside diphosphate kinase
VSDVNTGREEEFTVVFPGHANAAKARVSVLTAKGMAVLGYRSGDVVQYPANDRLRQIRIQELVFQPERDGRYDL